MSKTRAALDNLVSVIEGTTPDTSWQGNRTFRHYETPASVEQLRTVRDVTRAFVALLTGSRSQDGDMLQAREPGTVTQSFDVVVLYGNGDNLWDLQRLVAEDVDRLSYRLMLGSLWDPDTTGIWRRRVDNYQLELAVGGPGDVSKLTLPVVVQYRPTF